jgi:peroxiredoxin
MKVLQIIVFLFVNAFVLHSQNSSVGQFVFKGKVVGQDAGYVYLKYTDAFNKDVTDSCNLRRGEFEFTGMVNGATNAGFYGNIKSNSANDPNWTELFIEPGSITAIFKVNEFKQLKMTGSRAQDEFTTFIKRIDSLDKQWQPIFDDLKEARAGNDSIKLKRILNEQMPQYTVERRATTLKLIKEFPNSDISAYFLQGQNYLSVDSLKYYYWLFTPAVQHSFYGKEVETAILKQERLQIGKIAPDFVQTDQNGNVISLSKFSGKYILLEFWASWCVPFREENRYLKKAYNKYHGTGFEIIAFSIDVAANKNAWLEAIKKDNLPWIQICDFKSYNSEIVSAYNYFGGNGIPANFLIDPNGQIIARDLRGSELEDKLEQLLTVNSK